MKGKNSLINGRINLVNAGSFLRIEDLEIRLKFFVHGYPQAHAHPSVKTIVLRGIALECTESKQGLINKAICLSYHPGTGKTVYRPLYHTPCADMS